MSELQFEQAEYEGEGAPSGPLPCTACERPLGDAYYQAGGKVVCETCKAGIEQALAGGSGLARFFRAWLLGALGGLVGAAIYAGSVVLTTVQWGIIALVIGFLVGGGVSLGARRRGGWLYQLLAAVLTYLSISVSYIPVLYHQLGEEADLAALEEPAAAQAGAEAGAEAAAPGELPAGPTDAPSPADAPTVGATAAGDVPGDAAEAMRGDAMPGDAMPDAGVAASVEPAGEDFDVMGEEMPASLQLLLLFVFSFAMPILDAMEGPILVLIYGFAIYQAVIMNKKLVVEFSGPHPVGELTAALAAQQAEGTGDAGGAAGD